MRLLFTFALTLALAGFAPQGTRQGSPEEKLPANIVRLTHFGERASWSPDDKRIAFMEKSFGDVYEVDVATKNIRLLTHYPHAGFLRAQFLPNGDYFLIGARTFTDIQTTRSRDQEMWILKADAKPGDRPLALEHKISEGVAISKKIDENRLVEHARPVPGPPRPGRVGHLHGRHRLRGRTAAADEQEGSHPREDARVHARGAGLSQERHRARSTPAIGRPSRMFSVSTLPAARSPSIASCRANTTRSKGSSRMASTRSSSRAASSSSRIRTTSTSGS